MHVPRAKSGVAIFKGACAPKDPTKILIKSLSLHRTLYSDINFGAAKL